MKHTPYQKLNPIMTKREKRENSFSDIFNLLQIPHQSHNEFVIKSKVAKLLVPVSSPNIVDVFRNFYSRNSRNFHSKPLAHILSIVRYLI